MGLHNKHFYYSTIRKYVVSFGNIFNNLYIVRFDQNGVELQRERVPMAYGPKEKYLYRLQQNPDLNETFSIKLPRVAYELTKVRYDPARKTPPNNKIRSSAQDTGDKVWSYNPVPYQFIFKVSVMGKNSDECLQIVEQVAPFFTPDHTVTIDAHPNFQTPLDIPITLDDIAIDDNWNGDFTERRHITWEMTFTLSGFLYPPTRVAPIILQSEWNVAGYDNNDIVDTGIVAPTP